MTELEIESLQIGDVILFGKNRTPRIIRAITGSPRRSTKPVRVCLVTVAIRKCSWTERAQTHLDRSTLRNRCEKAGFRVRLDRPLDKLFDEEINGTNFMGCAVGKALPA